MHDAIALFDPISSAAFLKPAAKELGFKVVGVFTKPIDLFCEIFHTSKEALFSNCDEVIVAESLEEILRQLKLSKFAIKAAVAGIDSGVTLTDQVCNALGLWSNPIVLSNARSDKGAMRKRLKEKGLSCPDFQLCTSEKEALAFAEYHSFPLVIKTPQGAATSQVYVCHDMRELTKNFHDIMDRKDFYGRIAKHAVIEEYIFGEEYVVNTFSDGKDVHITDVWVYEKIDTKTFKNIYYNIILLFPIQIPSLQPLLHEATKIVEAFGIERGSAHLEIKDDPRRGPTLIEINPRLAGARMPFLLKEHSNFDPYKKTIEVFRYGQAEMPKPIAMKKHCAIACCPIHESGNVEKISGIDAIEKLSSYEAHVLNIKPEDHLTATTDLTSTPLLVFLAHEERVKLLQDLEKVHKLFSVSFKAK
ncbi:MAG: ATP-grasp domain-containing protein [Chlamydiales bacterium]